MTPRKTIHEETFDAYVETVFALLHTPSAIRQLVGAFAGHTVGRMSLFDPPKRIKFSDFEAGVIPSQEFESIWRNDELFQFASHIIRQIAAEDVVVLWS